MELTFRAEIRWDALVSLGVSHQTILAEAATLAVVLVAFFVVVIFRVAVPVAGALLVHFAASTLSGTRAWWHAKTLRVPHQAVLAEASALAYSGAVPVGVQVVLTGVRAGGSTLVVLFHVTALALLAESFQHAVSIGVSEVPRGAVTSWFPLGVSTGLSREIPAVLAVATALGEDLVGSTVVFLFYNER